MPEIGTMIKRLIKKLTLLRKAFFTDFLKVHFSQFGEDIVLKELLRKDVKNGFYVDVGCYHPKKYSNSYYLYRLGWRGINIDMEEDKVSLFKMVRRHDHNVQCAVSDRQEKVRLYRFDSYGLGSTIDPDSVDRERSLLDVTYVDTRTLNQIIETSPFRGRQIDVLSIDVEGMDYNVLKSLNLDTYKPKIIIVEDNHRNIEEVLDTKIYNLLKQKGYVLRSWAFYSLIFVLPGADILKDREHRVPALMSENRDTRPA